jgi:hypothetical protein
MLRSASSFSVRKETVNSQQQIIILEKKLAQAKKNLKLFKRSQLNVLASANPLAEKLESEASGYEFSIKQLRAIQRKNRPNS